MRRKIIDDLPDPERLAPLIRAIERGEIRHEAMDRVLDELIMYRDTPVEELLQRYRRGADDEVQSESVLQEVVQRARSLQGRSVDTLVRWGMGELMRHFLGRLDPNLLRGRLEQELAVAAQGGTE